MAFDVRPAAVVTPAAAIFTVDGSISNTFQATLVAASTLVCKNIRSGQRCLLSITAGVGGPYNLSEEGGASKVQELVFMGAATLVVAGASQTNCVELVGQADGSVLVGKVWDGVTGV